MSDLSNFDAKAAAVASSLPFVPLPVDNSADLEQLTLVKREIKSVVDRNQRVPVLDRVLETGVITDLRPSVIEMLRKEGYNVIPSTRWQQIIDEGGDWGRASASTYYRQVSGHVVNWYGNVSK
jgi:hypothetical protein